LFVDPFYLLNPRGTLPPRQGHALFAAPVEVISDDRDLAADRLHAPVEGFHDREQAREIEDRAVNLPG